MSADLPQNDNKNDDQTAQDKPKNTVANDADAKDNDNNPSKVAQLSIDSVCVYPVKSCGPLIMNNINMSYPFTKSGLKYDRKWKIINSSTKKKITQREYPKLALVQPSLTSTHLIMNIDNKKCEIELNSSNNNNDDDCGNEVAQLLTEYIGIDCRLIKNKQNIQSWDSDPLLIVFKESINLLNKKITNNINNIKYDYLRFRPNILLSGIPACDEESIKYIKFDQSTWKCKRNLWHDGCLNVTTIDYKKGTFDADNEPKNTLKSWKNALFGLGLKIDSGKDDGTLVVGSKATAYW